MARRRTIEVAKHVVFLMVTLVGAGYLLANLSWLGLWGIAGLLIASAMLTVYALQRWGRGRERPGHDARGHTAVLLALPAACVLLVLVLLEGLRQRNVVTVVVVGSVPGDVRADPRGVRTEAAHASAAGYGLETPARPSRGSCGSPTAIAWSCSRTTYAAASPPKSSAITGGTSARAERYAAACPMT